MNYSVSQTTTLWRQVWGLAALLAAMLFSWTIYGLYQPKILSQLEFTWLATNLSILQGLLGGGIEPLVGLYSDRIMRRFGSRLPQITVGVTLAGLIFVITALLANFNPQGIFRSMIPVLMTLWVIAMIIFRGPAIAQLQQLAPAKELPKANAVLTLVFGLVGSLVPLLEGWLQQIGALIAFMLGAIFLVLGAILMYATIPSQQRMSEPVLSLNSPTPESLSSLRFSLFMRSIVGLGIGLNLNLLLTLLPSRFHYQLENITPSGISAIILFVSAMAAVPMGEVTKKLGNRIALSLGLTATTVCLGQGLSISSNLTTTLPIILIIGTGIAFGLVTVSMLPFVLAGIPKYSAGSSIGLYFGSSSVGGAIAIWLARQSESLQTYMGEVSFLILLQILFCIFITKFSDNYLSK